MSNKLTRRPSAVEEVYCRAEPGKGLVSTAVALRHAEELDRLRAENAALRATINDYERNRAELRGGFETVIKLLDAIDAARSKNG